MTGTNEGNTENGKDRDKLTDSTTDTPKSTENGNKTGTDIEEKSGNEIGVKDGTGTEKEPKTRSVSFNSDVHVKRFGKPRESRSASKEPTVRREFTYRSPQELKDEAEKVIAQTSGITCTADHPPEKFFSLPHRKKLKEERDRRNSDDATAEKGKTPLGRSTSDASQRRKERTSLSTLFRRAKEKNKVNTPITISPKPVVVVKRSKSDVSDLKSNTALDPKSKPIRKRSGSETEEFLRSLRNKKTQLSPIIESSPRDDYFRKTPPLGAFQKQTLSQKESVKSEDYKLTNDIKGDVKTKVNPIQKPPRYSSSEKTEPKPPIRTKRGKSLEKDKEKSPPIAETPKRKTDVKKTLLVDEIDCKIKDINPVEVKERIKDSIRKMEENVYGDREMIHSSQKPPDKPPLTRGHTVDQIVRILKEDQQSPPPKSHLISPTNGTNANQPFSYIKPSVSPDPNLFVRNSPDRVPTPVNTMADKGVVYAHVVRDQGDNGSSHLGKQTIHKTYSPSREKYGNISDEDEGLGYEDRHKYSSNRYGYNYKNDIDNNYNSLEGPKITDSPIRPRFREYKLTSFDDFEPTYANEFPTTHDKSNDYIDTFRGRGDGMDTKKKFESENKIDLDFNELSHRRKLLESRLNARRYERERNPGEPVSRYLAETDPIYEAEKRMKATEKYVNETAKYIHHTLQRDGFAESSITEDYNRYDEDSHKVKYNTETRTFSKVPKGELDRQEFIDTLEPRYKGSKVFPPEPEYEPPSLELNTGKPIASPDEFTEKKYKVKKHFTSSQDVLQTNKYKGKDGWFGQRKGHYASNPEIAQEREDDYANVRYDTKHAETYHNSLRRMKNKDRYREEHGIRRHDSGDSRDYYRDDMSPRRFDIDSRLVDSGIENDFRKESSGEIHRKPRVYESDEDVRNTSLFLASERQHTEDNYPSEQIYANGEYTARFKEYDDGYRKEYSSREKSGDDGSILHTKDRYDRSPIDDKVSAKPPKATKKLSGLEKVKQLFSRDSSKKSKKEKEVQPKPRTRVLESPEHLRDDSEYRRFTDPEPSDLDSRKKEYDRDERRYRSSREMERQRSPRRERDSPRDEVDRHRSPPDLKYRGSRESLDRHRSSKENLDRYQNSREDLRYRSSDPRDSDVERKYRDADLERRYERKHAEDRHATERVETRKYVVPLGLTDRCSEPRGSDAESERRKTRSRTAGPRIDSPALDWRTVAASREGRTLRAKERRPDPGPLDQESIHRLWCAKKPEVVTCGMTDRSSRKGPTLKAKGGRPGPGPLDPE
ncbi:hypothetical protein NE865_06480 [Phthorimaea operculella]|nr:hypothetical protein NE865_06480 [Phthorimaea operculella]